MSYLTTEAEQEVQYHPLKAQAYAAIAQAKALERIADILDEGLKVRS